MASAGLLPCWPASMLHCSARSRNTFRCYVGQQEAEGTASRARNSNPHLGRLAQNVIRMTVLFIVHVHYRACSPVAIADGFPTLFLACNSVRARAVLLAQIKEPYSTCCSAASIRSRIPVMPPHKRRPTRGERIQAAVRRSSSYGSRVLRWCGITRRRCGR